MSDTHRTCSDCGKPNLFLIKVVDELGRDEVCGLCVISLLARLGQSGDITLFVARPAALQK